MVAIKNKPECPDNPKKTERPKPKPVVFKIKQTFEYEVSSDELQGYSTHGGEDTFTGKTVADLVKFIEEILCSERDPYIRTWSDYFAEMDLPYDTPQDKISFDISIVKETK